MVLLTCVYNVLLAEPRFYIQTKDSAIALIAPVFTISSNVVKVEVSPDNIIRVIPAPYKKNSTESSAVVYTTRSHIIWNVFSTSDNLTLKTKTLTTVFNFNTGLVSSYWDTIQNNTEVTIPFLVQGKNYGIVWDNYSLAKADDMSEPHPPSSLQLLLKKGNFPGMLKKRYFRQKLIPYEKPTVLSVERKDGVLIKYNGSSSHLSSAKLVN